MTGPNAGGNNPSQNVNQTLQNMQSEIDYLKEAVQILSNGIISLARCNKSLKNNLCVSDMLNRINGTNAKHRDSIILKNNIDAEIKKP